MEQVKGLKEYRELELYYKILDYSPAQEPSHAVCHDDPTFGDPGSPAEVEFELYFYNHYKKEYILVEQKEIYEFFYENILEMAREKHEDAIEDAIIGREEAREEMRRLREEAGYDKYDC